jgi:hypothetical protein
VDFPGWLGNEAQVGLDWREQRFFRLLLLSHVEAEEIDVGRLGAECAEHGAGNHLAVVPVKGNSMIFVTVPSGSGAKYAAEEFTWWEAGGRGTTFSSDFPGPKASSECHEVK